MPELHRDASQFLADLGRHKQRPPVATASLEREVSLRGLRRLFEKCMPGSTRTSHAVRGSVLNPGGKVCDSQHSWFSAARGDSLAEDLDLPKTHAATYPRGFTTSRGRALSSSAQWPSGLLIHDGLHYPAAAKLAGKMHMPGSTRTSHAVRGSVLNPGGKVCDSQHSWFSAARGDSLAEDLDLPKTHAATDPRGFTASRGRALSSSAQWPSGLLIQDGLHYPAAAALAGKIHMPGSTRTSHAVRGSVLNPGGKVCDSQHSWFSAARGDSLAEDLDLPETHAATYPRGFTTSRGWALSSSAQWPSGLLIHNGLHYPAAAALAGKMHMPGSTRKSHAVRGSVLNPGGKVCDSQHSWFSAARGDSLAEDLDLPKTHAATDPRGFTTSRGRALSSSAQWPSGLLIHNGLHYPAAAALAGKMHMPGSTRTSHAVRGSVLNPGRKVCDSQHSWFSAARGDSLAEDLDLPKTHAATDPRGFTTSRGRALSSSAQWPSGLLINNGFHYPAAAALAGKMHMPGSTRTSHAVRGSVLNPGGKVCDSQHSWFSAASGDSLAEDLDLPKTHAATYPRGFTTSRGRALSSSAQWPSGLLIHDGLHYPAAAKLAGKMHMPGSTRTSHAVRGSVLNPGRKVCDSQHSWFSAARGDSLAEDLDLPKTHAATYPRGFTTSRGRALSSSAQWPSGLLIHNGLHYPAAAKLAGKMHMPGSTRTSHAVRGSVLNPGRKVCYSQHSWFSAARGDSLAEDLDLPKTHAATDPRGFTTSRGGALSSSAQWPSGLLIHNGLHYPAAAALAGKMHMPGSTRTSHAVRGSVLNPGGKVCDSQHSWFSAARGDSLAEDLDLPETHAATYPRGFTTSRGWALSSSAQWPSGLLIHNGLHYPAAAKLAGKMHMPGSTRTSHAVRGSVLNPGGKVCYSQHSWFSAARGDSLAEDLDLPKAHAATDPRGFTTSRGRALSSSAQWPSGLLIHNGLHYPAAAALAGKMHMPGSTRTSHAVRGSVLNPGRKVCDSQHSWFSAARGDSLAEDLDLPKTHAATYPRGFTASRGRALSSSAQWPSGLLIHNGFHYPAAAKLAGKMHMPGSTRTSHAVRGSLLNPGGKVCDSQHSWFSAARGDSLAEDLGLPKTHAATYPRGFTASRGRALSSSAQWPSGLLIHNGLHYPAAADFRLQASPLSK